MTNSFEVGGPKWGAPWYRGATSDAIYLDDRPRKRLFTQRRGEVVVAELDDVDVELEDVAVGASVRSIGGNVNASSIGPAHAHRWGDGPNNWLVTSLLLDDQTR